MPGIVTPAHCRKMAFIYIRQSSPHQVEHHTLSQEVQRNLKNRALSLGWPEQNIKLIDEDLGSSATEAGIRSGFQYIVQNVCQDIAGALFFQYASRLARNGKEWYQALEVCTVFHVLIIDRDTIYDPSLANDRLMLGMQGAFSEYEVNQMQLRAREAIDLKASQGKLIIGLPSAYVKTEDGRIEKTADQRIRQAIEGVFARFDELASINKVFKWYLSNNVELPVRDSANGNKPMWHVPSYNTISNILSDPIYAGTYMYPKTKTRTHYEDGRIIKTSGHRVTEQDNPIVIYNHFEPYISKEQYDQNQQIIANNTISKLNLGNGAPREGDNILAGIVRCGHCSHNMKIRYNKTKKREVSYIYYYCPNYHSFGDTEQEQTLGFNGTKLEQIVSQEIFKVVAPHAIEAALVAEQKYNQIAHEKLVYLANSIEQAKYEADRIERQYNRVEPENRLVAATLEQRWQKALEKVKDLQQQYHELQSQQLQLTDQQREQLFELADDLDRVWNHPQCDYREKTRLVRLLIKDIWIERLTPNKLKATIHWQGGVHTNYEFARRAPYRNRHQHQQQIMITADIIKQLARVCDDEQIVRILNRANYRPQKAETHVSWTKTQVEQIRHKNNIPQFSEQAYQRLGIVNLQQAAEMLDVSMETVLQLIKAGIIQAHQVIKYAPWEIETSELSKKEVIRYIKSLRQGKKKTLNKNQLNLT
jgi:DNA invertase Pin-like site-specific DNA recombinase